MSCYSAIVLCVRSIAFLLSCTKRRPVGGGGGGREDEYMEVYVEVLCDAGNIFFDR